MKRTATWLTFVLMTAAVACSSKSDDGESGSSAVSSNPEELKACRMFDVRQQKFIELTDFVADDAHPERANDPVLQKLMAGVLAGKSCPKTYAEMQEVEELQSCNLQTRVISERAQLTGQPDEGR